MRWYLNRTGNAEGPFDEPTLVGMISRGEVQAVHQICPEGTQAWLALDSHPAFAQALAGPAPQAAPGAPMGADTDIAVQAPGSPPSQPQYAAQPAQQAQQPQFGAQPAGQPAGQPQFGVQATQQPMTGGDFNSAANQVAGEVEGAANAFGAALASPGAAPVLAAPGAAAPGEGFFEMARAEGATPSEAALDGASKGHLFAALGAFVTCGCAGGIGGSFLGSILYKEQPKSPFALFHLNQALVFQGVMLATNVVIAIIVQIAAFVGSMIMPILGTVASAGSLLNLAVFAAAVILPLLQMGKAKKGEWSEYPVIGKKVMGLKSPILK